MLKTLGLDDDLDTVEAVEEIEKAFGIAIANSEAEAIETVGQMFDLLRAKIVRNEQPGKCASAMAFYRLRRALRAQIGDAPFTPSQDMSPLHAKYTKRFRGALELETGLHLPRPSFTWIGDLGVLAAVIGMLGGLASIAVGLSSLLFAPHLAHQLMGIAPVCLFGSVFVFLLAAWLDPGRAPKDCKTLGDLAEKTATLSYGALIRQGADASDRSLWQVLTDVLSEISNVPASEIARETYFLQSAA